MSTVPSVGLRPALNKVLLFLVMDVCEEEDKISAACLNKERINQASFAIK